MKMTHLFAIKKSRNNRFATMLVLSLTFGMQFAHGESQFVPVGTAEDTQYAVLLWDTMVKERIEGDGRIPAEPFFGGAKPHGEILELIFRNITVGRHTGYIVVKRNYGKAGASDVRGRVTVDSVKKNRSKYLDSITVMFQRETGYDLDNQNWFWVKYRPDGTLFSKKMGMQSISMAGRLMKGKLSEDSSGCIYCHSAAGGGDYIFYPHITP